MNICQLKNTRSKNHWWVDGVSGFVIGGGETAKEAIMNAVRYIINSAEHSYAQRPLYENMTDEIFGIFEQYYCSALGT